MILMRTCPNDNNRKQYEDAAAKIAGKFSIKNHAKEVYEYLKSVS